MSSLALQIQRHIYNNAYVPKVRVMARVSVRVRVIGLGLGKTNKTSNRCVFHTN